MSKKEIPHGIIYSDGTLEIMSNDRKLKIILSKVTIYQDGENVEAFRTTYFVKEGLEWERTLESANYRTLNEFLEIISKVVEFSQAVIDVLNNIIEERNKADG